MPLARLPKRLSPLRDLAEWGPESSRHRGSEHSNHGKGHSPLRQALRALPLLLAASTGLAQAPDPVNSAPPWMAALVDDRFIDPYEGQFCGATLIDPEWLLTAAHCVDQWKRFGWTLRALLGTEELAPGEGRLVRVAEIRLHPDFVPEHAPAGGTPLDNDIALLRLAQPVYDLAPVTLPGFEFDVMMTPAGTATTMFGWGAEYDAVGGIFDFPRRLKALSLPLVSGPACHEVTDSSRLSANMLCAGYIEGGIDSCLGDSGGPLAIPDPETASGWRQLGIVSWGQGCGEAGHYGLYTRLARYTDWISGEVCSADERPGWPRILSLSSRDGLASIHFSSAGADARYRLYYAPWAPFEELSPIRYFDLGQARHFSATAQPGESYAVAVQAWRGPCLGLASDIRRVDF